MNEPFSEELISAYLDDELSAAQRELVEKHLAQHPEARQKLKQWRGLREDILALPRHELDDSFSNRVLQQIQHTHSSPPGASHQAKDRRPTSDPSRKKTPSRSETPTSNNDVSWRLTLAAMTAVAATLVFAICYGPQSTQLPPHEGRVAAHTNDNAKKRSSAPPESNVQLEQRRTEDSNGRSVGGGGGGPAGRGGGGALDSEFKRNLTGPEVGGRGGSRGNRNKDVLPENQDKMPVRSSGAAAFSPAQNQGDEKQGHEKRAGINPTQPNLDAAHHQEADGVLGGMLENIRGAARRSDLLDLEKKSDLLRRDQNLPARSESEFADAFSPALDRQQVVAVLSMDMTKQQDRQIEEVLSSHGIDVTSPTPDQRYGFGAGRSAAPAQQENTRQQENFEVFVVEAPAEQIYAALGTLANEYSVETFRAPATASGLALQHSAADASGDLAGADQATGGRGIDQGLRRGGRSAQDPGASAGRLGVDGNLSGADAFSKPADSKPGEKIKPASPRKGGEQQQGQRQRSRLSQSHDDAIAAEKMGKQGPGSQAANQAASGSGKKELGENRKLAVDSPKNANAVPPPAGSDDSASRSRRAISPLPTGEGQGAGAPVNQPEGVRGRGQKLSQIELNELVKRFLDRSHFARESIKEIQNAREEKTQDRMKDVQADSLRTQPDDDEKPDRSRAVMADPSKDVQFSQQQPQAIPASPFAGKNPTTERVRLVLIVQRHRGQTSAPVSPAAPKK